MSFDYSFIYLYSYGQFIVNLFFCPCLDLALSSLLDIQPVHSAEELKHFVLADLFHTSESGFSDNTYEIKIQIA